MKKVVDLSGPELEERLERLSEQLENLSALSLQDAWALTQEGRHLEEVARLLESDSCELALQLREKAKSTLSRWVQEGRYDALELEVFLQERVEVLKKSFHENTLEIKEQTKLFYAYQEEILWMIHLVERAHQILPEDPINVIEVELKQINQQIQSLAKEGWDVLQIKRANVVTQEALVVRQIDAYIHVLEREVGHELSPEGLWVMFERAHKLLRQAEMVLQEESLPAEKKAILETKKTQLLAIKEEVLKLMEEQTPENKEFWLNSFYEFCSSLQSKIEEEPLPNAVHALEQVPVKFQDIERLLPQEKKAEKPHRTKLKRFRKYFRNETLEKKLQYRLESIFGHRFVVFFDNFILFLIVAVIGLLFVEWKYEAYFHAHQRQFEILIYIDTAICCVFLLEFFTKLFLSSDRWLYFRRHVLFDFLPSIPFGLFHLAEANLVRMGRLGRFARVFRFIRIARPIIRLARLVFLMIRVMDRIVKKYGSLLNRNLVLFEREAFHLEAEKTVLNKLYDLQGKSFRRIRSGIRELPIEEQLEILSWRIDRLDILLEKTKIGTGEYRSPLDEAQNAGSSRDIPLDYVVAELIRLDENKVQDILDPDIVNTLGRYLRYLDIPLVRKFPIIRALTREMKQKSNAQILAQLGRMLGRLSELMLRCIYFIADFRGIVTPQQLLDRVGRTLINSTKRPAVRLLMLGASFFLIQALVHYFNLHFLGEITDRLSRVLGTPVIIVGSICLIPLVIGVWFTSIAGQASFFYQQVAEAQYINLLKELKNKNCKRDTEILKQRVFRGENKEDSLEEVKHKFIERLNEKFNLRWDREERLFPVWAEGDMVLLMYFDYLDGAIFYRTDTKTSEQLLGNLVIDGIKRERLRYTKKDLKRLEKLDLSGAVKNFFGPQLCFNFITDSLSQRSARLLVEYNTNCFPKKWHANVSNAEQKSMQAWLEGKQRAESQEQMQKLKEKEKIPEGTYRSTDFNSLHFLTASPERDNYIEQRYGEEIAELMKLERRGLFRNIFGTYPLHLLSKEVRTINLYQIYQERIAGGKVFLSPFFLLKAFLKGIGKVIKTLYKSVRIILNPELDDPHMQENEAGFHVAIRHINRMRKPVFMEILKMRSLFDYEYLGLATPGYSNPMNTTIQDDLNFIGAVATERRFYQEMIQQRERQMIQFRHFLHSQKMEEDDFTAFLKKFNDPDGNLVLEQRRVLRSLCTAYIINYRNLATNYEAYSAVQKFFKDYFSEKNLTRTLRRRKHPPFFASKKRKQLFEDCIEHTPYKNISGIDRFTCMNVFLRDSKVVEASKILIQTGGLTRIMEQVKDIIQHWAMWKQQLVCLRTLQTLSVMDIQNYRDTIYQLGCYDASFDWKLKPSSRPPSEKIKVSSVKEKMETTLIKLKQESEQLSRTSLDPSASENVLLQTRSDPENPDLNLSP